MVLFEFRMSSESSPSNVTRIGLFDGLIGRLDGLIGLFAVLDADK
jgi:hypothetical protein